MSGSTAVLAPRPPPNPPSTMTPVCTHCGNAASSPDEAHLRIQDLEAQVRLLNTKAAAAVDKLADYEDEVRSLKSAYAQLQQQHQEAQSAPPKQQTQLLSPNPTPPSTGEQPLISPTLTPTTASAPNPSSPPRNTSRLASLSSFLPGRKRDTALLSTSQQPPTTPSVALFSQQRPSSSPSPHNPPPTPGLANPISTLDPSTSHSEISTLQATLETERTLRLRAESNLTQTQSELEELTATLFGQANEMVAQERKARAKLEERVKVLEDRDGEKRRRLDRLEGALKRIERVRGLVREEMGKGRFDVGSIERGEADSNTKVGEKIELRVVNDVVAVKT